MVEVCYIVYTSSMALSIKSDDADRLARELAAETGETLTEAVETALRERLWRARAGEPCRRYVGGRSGHPRRAGGRRTCGTPRERPHPADASRHPCRAGHRYRGSAVACRAGRCRPVSS